MAAHDTSAGKNLLVELFVEELPPKALRKLGDAFAAGIAASLTAQGLVDAAATVTPFASPRRLAVHITAVRAAAPDKAVSHKLMPASVGLDAEGRPTAALRKKLAALNADADAAARLERRLDGKAEALFLDTVQAGATLAQGLQKALDDSLAKLPIPKLMSYQLETGALPGWTSVHFVRPAHGLVALHGDAVVPVQALGLEAGRSTHGHRFEAVVDPIELRDADSYAAQLADDGAVIASFDARRDAIAQQLAAAAQREGLTPIDDAALLDEVTALVERPNVLLGRFDGSFLGVPQECLILTMKANQKYFPLLDVSSDPAGRLTHKFLIVSNIAPADPSAVIGGNERVVRPRLADAKFFFDQDRKKTLAERLPGLAKVVYHAKLGSQHDRMERVRAIARGIGDALVQAGGLTPQQQAAVDQAAQLAKADLLTDMVGEFPELQGTMGRYYAQHEGLPDDVAEAIEDHYKPRFAGDALPRGPVGLVLALADKLETLAGLFSIGQLPTGDKDPFALRRHALGVVRILVEQALPLALDSLLSMAVETLPATLASDVPVSTKRGLEPAVWVTDPSPTVEDELRQFIDDRFAGQLKEQGFAPQDIEAVLSLYPARLDDVPRRLAAVRAFKALPEAGALAAANKRVGNILKKAEGGVAPRIDAALLREPAEVALADALQGVAPRADAAFERGDHAASLQALAALRGPVDAFFDGVMVNADDPALRANRLGLLASLHAAMNRVADLSKLAA